MKKELTYEEAMTQLEAIVQQIERGELSIDDLSAKVKEATELVQKCKEILHTTDEAIDKMLDTINT
ncbi:MAG TPA: exodeoxyribonuclease VII small subunit [Paludibacteraceae bacterium]|nr:exodeoxyribonuclease VII small subunit [Paludibacteraceae bacterium]